MHKLATRQIVQALRRRRAQGDCPTEPRPATLEQLEEIVLDLADQQDRDGEKLLATTGPKGDPGPKCPTCGGYPKFRFYGADSASTDPEKKDPHS